MRRLLFLILMSVILTAPAAWGFDVPEQFRKGVTVVHSDSMAPLAFLGINKTPKGFLVDFWKKWSAETGVPVSFKLMKWTETLEYVRMHDNAIHGGLFSTIERTDYLDFSEKLYPIQSGLFVMRGSTIRSMGDLEQDDKVAVLDDGAAEERVRRRYPQVQLVEGDSAKEIAHALVEGRVDAVVADYPALMYLGATFGAVRDLEMVQTLYEDSLRAGLRKGQPELLDLIERGYALIDDDERTNILHRWFVMEVDRNSTMRTVVYTGATVFLLILLGLYLYGFRKSA